MSESTRRKLILGTLAVTWVLAVGFSDVVAARLRAAIPAATRRMVQQ